MGKTGIPAKIRTYKEAETIIHGYEETRLYLTSLIQNHIPDPESVLSCADLAYLKHYGRVIKGVAERMLRTRVKKDTEKAILENISFLGNVIDPVKRQLLEDRICLQLEGCNVPNNHYLVKKYEKARNN